MKSKKMLSFLLIFLLFTGFLFTPATSWVSEDGEHIAEFYYTDFDDAELNSNYYNNSWLNVSNFGSLGSVDFDVFNPSDRFLNFSQYYNGECNLSFIYNDTLNLTDFSASIALIDPTISGIKSIVYLIFDDVVDSEPIYFVLEIYIDHTVVSVLLADSGTFNLVTNNDYGYNDYNGSIIITYGFTIKVGNDVNYWCSIGDDFGDFLSEDYNSLINSGRILRHEIKSDNVFGLNVSLLSCNIVLSNGYYDETFFDDNGNLRAFGTDHSSLQSWSDWPNDCFDSASWRVSPNDFGSGSNNELNSFWWIYNTQDDKDLNGEIKNFHTIVRYTWRKDSIPWNINTIGLWIKTNARFNLYYDGLSKKVFVNPIVSYIPNSYTSTDDFHSAYYELGWFDLTDLYNDPLYCNESQISFRVLLPGFQVTNNNDILGHLLNYEHNPPYDGSLSPYVGYRKYDSLYDFGTNNFFDPGYIWENNLYAKPLYYFSWDDIGGSIGENEYGLSITSYSDDFYLGTNVKVEWWCNTSTPNPDKWTVWIIDSDNDLFFDNDYSTNGFTGFTLDTNFPVGTYNAYIFDKDGSYNNNNRKTVSFIVKDTYIPPSGNYFIAQNFSNQPLEAGEISSFDWIASSGDSFYVLFKDIGVTPPLEMVNVTFYDPLTGSGSWEIGSFVCPNVNYSTYWRMFVYYVSNGTYYYPGYHTDVLVSDSEYIGHTVEVRYDEVYSGVSNYFGWTHPFDEFTYYIGVFDVENNLVDTAWNVDNVHVQSAYGNEYAMIINEVGTYNVLLYRYVGSDIHIDASVSYTVTSVYTEEPDDEDGVIADNIVLGLVITIGVGAFLAWKLESIYGLVVGSSVTAYILSLEELGTLRMLPSEVGIGIIVILVLIAFMMWLSN